MSVVEDAADVPTQAWDEGYDVGHRDGCLNWSADNSTNPYRAEMLRLEERRAVAASTDIPAMCPIDHPHVASLMTPRLTTPYGLCAECHRMDWHRVTCSFHDPAVNEHDVLVARAAAAEAARLLLSDAIRKYAAGVEHQRGVLEAAKKALDTLDAAIGATS